MFNSLPAPVLLDIAILFTGLAWALGFLVVDKRPHLFLAIAGSSLLCLIGYSAASLGAPAWVVVAAPLPVDFFLLWYVLRTPRKMAIAYPLIWVFYVLIHIGLSSLLHYDSLIPAWRLHA